MNGHYVVHWTLVYHPMKKLNYWSRTRCVQDKIINFQFGRLVATQWTCGCQLITRMHHHIGTACQSLSFFFFFLSLVQRKTFHCRFQANDPLFSSLLSIYSLLCAPGISSLFCLFWSSFITFASGVLYNIFILLFVIWLKWYRLFIWAGIVASPIVWSKQREKHTHTQIPSILSTSRAINAIRCVFDFHLHHLVFVGSMGLNLSNTCRGVVASFFSRRI